VLLGLLGTVICLLLTGVAAPELPLLLLSAGCQGV
jgi:hypothetical protein